MVDTVEKAIYALGVTGLDQLQQADQVLGRVAVTEEKVMRATRTTADGLERMIARVDARARAEQQLQRSLQQLARYEQEGVGTAARRAQALDLVNQRYSQQIAAAQRLTSAQNDNTQATGRGVVSATQMRFAMQNLGFQVQDVFVGLASGQRPMQVLIQQGSQIGQIFGQAGGASAVLAAAGAAIRSMITPTTLAVAGTAALAGGFGVLLSRATAVEARLRSFAVILQATGNLSGATPFDLLGVTRQLRATGSTTAEAQALVEAAARTPGINAAAYGTLTTLARDIAAGTGQQATSVVVSLERALLGGADAATKFVFDLAGPNGLTVAEAAAMREMDRLSDRAGAAGIAVTALQRRFGDLHEKALSPSTRALKELSDAWQTMLDRLSETTLIQTTIRGLENLAKIIEHLAKGDLRIGPISLDLGPAGSYQLTGPAPPVATAAIPPPIAGRPQNFNVATGVIMSGEANVFVDMLSSAAEKLPPGYGLIITSIGRPGGSQSPVGMGSAHVAGRAADFQIVGPSGPLPNTGVDTSGLYAQVYANALAAAQQTNPALAAQMRSGATFGARGGPISATSPADIGHIDLRGGAIVSNAISPEGQAALDRTREQFDRLNAATRLWGEEAARARAYADAFASSSRSGAEREAEAQQAATQAVEQHRIELAKAAQLQDAQTQGVIRSIDAFKQSEAAGYRVIAEEEARIEAMRTGGNAADIARRKLEEGAAAAVQAGRRQVAAAQPQILAQERIAEAASRGTAAQHEAELQAQAAARTQDALAKAEASRHPGLIAQARALNDAALAEVKRADAARAGLAAQTAANDNLRRIEAVQLQIGTLGLAPEEVQRQQALLQARQTAETQFVGALPEAKQAFLDSATALADINAKLAVATRESERWNDSIRSIASSIESTLTSAIESAFSGERIRNWGERIRSMLSSALSTLTANLFIRPAIGSVLGGLGFGSLATQYGSFGSLFGGGGGTSGGMQITQTGPNTFSLGNVASTASGGNSLFGGSGGGLFGTGGITNWLNRDIGPSLGFWGGTPNAPGLFGTTSFTSFLGGAGAGSAAGFLLNSLLGGNPITGGAGSIGGGLAGGLLGSLFGVPLIGGLLGGGLGGLFGGMFGNTRPANQSAGAGFNLATGRITGGFAGGNPQIDQPTLAASQALGNIVASLNAISGGALGGSLLLQNGRNTGVTLDYADVAGFGSGRMSLGRDPLRAVQQIGAALASVTPGAETLATVLTNLVDPSQIDAAIQFANVYDNLKTAADSAFASIEDASKQAGPFEQAKAQIIAIFDEISAKTREFGLALDPVNASLAEAQRRLTADFDQSIQDMILGVTDAGRLLVEEEKRAGEARLREVEAVNGNIAEVNRLNALMLDQIWQNQTQSLVQLQQELTAGSLSGLTVAAQLEAANDNFERTLALVQTGNLAEINNLALYGTSAVSLSQQAYGNAPQTAALIAEILAAIEAVLAVPPFASGTRSTPRGLILVGEQGPEFIDQPGGLRVWSNPDTERMLAGRGFPMDRSFAHGTMAAEPSYAEIVAELRAVRQELAEVKTLLGAGNTISRVAGAETTQHLRALRAAAEREPLHEPRRQKVG